MKKGLSRYLFMLPALFIYCAVVVAPALYSVSLSFFKWNGLGEKTAVGLKNYINLFTKDTVFRIALRNNFIWIVLTIVFTTGLALALAMLLNRTFRGRVIYRAVFYFPYMISWVVIGIIWKWIYNPNIGFLDEMIKVIGLDWLQIKWLSDPKIALYCIFVAALWQSVGQPMLYFLAGLQAIPNELFEAAKVDGAGKFSLFINITVPMLKETFVIVFATLIIASMKLYDVVFVMTNGGPANSTQTLASYMYSQTFAYSNLGTGSAIATIMMVVMMVVIIPYVLFTTKEE